MYLVKKSATTEEIVKKKSRFIGYIIPCNEGNAIVDALDHIASEHPNASHIAFAYRLKTPSGIRLRFSDAGEPSGTAGKPILMHLEGNDIINCLIAVVRYFGGVKLGTGGLVRAYGQAASRTIQCSTTYPYVEYKTIEITVEYQHLKILKYRLKQLDGEIVETTFTQSVAVCIRIPEKEVQTLIEEFGISD